MNTTHLISKPAQVRQGDVFVAPVLQPVDDSDIGELIEEFDWDITPINKGNVNEKK